MARSESFRARRNARRQWCLGVEAAPTVVGQYAVRFDVVDDEGAVRQATFIVTVEPLVDVAGMGHGCTAAGGGAAGVLPGLLLLLLRRAGGRCFRRP